MVAVVIVGRIMPRFGVNFVTDAYFVINAKDQSDALDEAYDLLYNSLVGEYDWDCNECMELDEE